jgi:hypothetical protein
LCQFTNAVNGLLKQENRVYDDKAAKLALEEAAAVSQEAEAFELLRRELAVLESRVRQSARRANADMVGLLICPLSSMKSWSHLPLRSFQDT